MNNTLLIISHLKYPVNYGKFCVCNGYKILTLHWQKKQKFALPVSICVTLRNAFASCTQVPCDAGVSMETTLLNGKIRLQNSFILITFNFSICSKYFSLFNMEWTWNITNLWAEGWYISLAQLFRHCHPVLVINSFCSHYYLYKKDK